MIFRHPTNIIPVLAPGNCCCWYINILSKNLLYHSGCSFWLHRQLHRFVICGTHFVSPWWTKLKIVQKEGNGCCWCSYSHHLYHSGCSFLFVNRSTFLATSSDCVPEGYFISLNSSLNNKLCLTGNKLGVFLAIGLVKGELNETSQNIRINFKLGSWLRTCTRILNFFPPTEVVLQEVSW